MPWVRLLATSELAPGAVRSATVLSAAEADAVDGDDGVGGANVPGPAERDLAELDLVIWRTLDGRPVVCDARCPHQWSHLEAEGVVDGDELVCTSHFWRFDVDGRGSKLSMHGRRDPKGDVATYPCREQDGAVEVLLAAPGTVEVTPAAGV